MPRPKLVKGFVCPNGCAGELRVINSKKKANGVVTRRRKCDVCNYRETTEERRKAAR